MTILAIVGPTAAGKSALALDLALALDGEIVNADSMQLYRGMDIGTAKTPPDQRRGVVHHCLDMFEPSHDVSVVEYREAARTAIDDIVGRGRVALLVGGSWLYVQAVLDDLQFPGTDPVIRAAWEARLDQVGPEALHAELAQRDPVAAQAILPTNGRRIVRALEVVTLTGSFTASLPEPRPWRSARWIGVTHPRSVLDERIVRRVEAMWGDGLVAEVRALRDPGRTARAALGYRQVLDWLGGIGDETTARAETIRATRRFARRQERRFRQDPRIHWLAPGSEVGDVVDMLQGTAT